MKNISQQDIRGVRIPLLGLAEQAQVASASAAFVMAKLKARRVRDALARLRSAMLFELLSGSHEVPNAYDRFLDAVA